MEGTNNKTKTMKRPAYGFRDQEFFKLKVLALHETRYELVGKAGFESSSDGARFCRMNPLLPSRSRSSTAAPCSTSRRPSHNVSMR
jgi:hypothetical protein